MVKIDSKLILTCPIVQKSADFWSAKISNKNLCQDKSVSNLWLAECGPIRNDYRLGIFLSSIHDHFNFNFLISTNESLMLFTATVPGPKPNSGKVMSHMTTNPIIKMDKRWSLLSNKGSLPHSPSTTTHTFFDIKAEFCPLSLVHQNSPLSIVSG